MMMMSFGALGLVSVLWVLYGYSLAFGKTRRRPGRQPRLRRPRRPAWSAAPSAARGTAPAIPTAGLRRLPADVRDHHRRADQRRDRRPRQVRRVDGVRRHLGDGRLLPGRALGLRVRRRTPRHVGGWIANDLKAIDFAGGTAVHINAGAAGLALALVLGKRIGFAQGADAAAQPDLVMLGAGLLWFGWFGFNAGSALGCRRHRRPWRSINTHGRHRGRDRSAGSSSEKIRDGHATTLGAASGVVAGLVAITPACGAVNPVGAILVGAIAGAVCCAAVGLKYRFGFDDSLDVVGVHLVGGVVGTLLIGILGHRHGTRDGVNGAASTAAVSTSSAGRSWQRLRSLAYSFVATYIIGTIIDKTIGFRVSEEDEISGHRPHDPRRDRRTSSARSPVAATCAGIGAGRRLDEGEGRRMKLVTAVIKPFKLDDVKSRAGGLRRARHDGDRGQRLRPAARPHRGLPGGGVHRRPGAEGAASRCWSTTPTPRTSSTSS